MIPYAQYRKFVRMDETEVLSRFDKLIARMETVNARYSDEEVERDLQNATRETRSRKRRA